MEFVLQSSHISELACGIERKNGGLLLKLDLGLEKPFPSMQNSLVSNFSMAK
jgi:hypothetical protein